MNIVKRGVLYFMVVAQLMCGNAFANNDKEPVAAPPSTDVSIHPYLEPAAWLAAATAVAGGLYYMVYKVDWKKYC